MKITPSDLQALLIWALQYNSAVRIEGNFVVVDGYFSCAYNNLTSLPDFIGNMKVKGYFDCSYNRLTLLPESIGNMQVGRDFYCAHNTLTSLPDSIGNMKVGGSFYCSNNPLPKNHLRPQELVEGIYDDYTFLDGILTDIISTKTLDGKKVIKHSFGYVVSDGTNHAHGEDLRTALF